MKLVKDGDWVDYSVGIGFPVLLDAALAKRKDELRDIKIRGSLAMQPIQAVEQDFKARMAPIAIGSLAAKMAEGSFLFLISS